jgi:hypothetical protein
MAIDLKMDMQDLPQTLRADYLSRIETALSRLVKGFERTIESMGPTRGDGKHGIEASLFVGRVALYVAKSSSFLSDLTVDGNLKLGKVLSFQTNRFPD